MASEERVRLEIAFDGGQVMNVHVVPSAADQLERSLAAGDDGTLPIDSDDGRYTLNLRRVVYVKRFTREARVGFTNA